MLEGLDNIQWGQLNHAYGSADDVPDLIRALAHEDDDIRDKTLYALYGNIWHQGTVYEATPYAVPFLIELLSIDHVTRKYDILILLAHLAHGTSYFDIQSNDLLSGEHESDGIQQQLAEEVQHVKRTHQAVCDGIDVYWQLLLDQHEELHTRMAVTYLLSCFTEHELSIVPRLKQLLPDEPDSLMRASLVLALRYLQQGGTSTYYLEPYLAPDEDLIVRVCSGMAIASIATHETPMRVIDLLIAVLKHASIVEEAYEQLTWSEGDIMGDICKALMHTGYKKLEPVIPDMIRVLRRVDFYSAPTYVDALMVILFDGQPLDSNRSGNDLTPYQRLMLQTLLESPTIWRIRLNDGKTMLNGNISNMMQAYHLPANPDEMRAFLG